MKASEMNRKNDYLTRKLVREIEKQNKKIEISHTAFTQKK